MGYSNWATFQRITTDVAPSLDGPFFRIPYSLRCNGTHRRAAKDDACSRIDLLLQGKTVVQQSMMNKEYNNISKHDKIEYKKKHKDKDKDKDKDKEKEKEKEKKKK